MNIYRIERRRRRIPSQSNPSDWTPWHVVIASLSTIEPSAPALELHYDDFDDAIEAVAAYSRAKDGQFRIVELLVIPGPVVGSALGKTP